MTSLLAYPVAIGAALPTTLLVLALWVAHARVLDGDSADSVFLSFVFLFMPLIFFVSLVSNLAAVVIGHAVGLFVPGADGWVTIAAAGVLVWACCAWTQGGMIRMARSAGPVSAVPVALFGIADMLILAGGLHLLARQTLS